MRRESVVQNGVGDLASARILGLARFSTAQRWVSMYPIDQGQRKAQHRAHVPPPALMVLSHRMPFRAGPCLARAASLSLLRLQWRQGVHGLAGWQDRVAV